MRLRNIKNKEEILNNSTYVIKDYNNNCGKWNEVFQNNNPIHLEIGVGKGKFIFENAEKNTQNNYIGIEKNASILSIAVKRHKDINLPNLKLICADAENINKIFSKEIDTLYLNFSDPWPKKRHHMRRLTSSKFLNLYEEIFKISKTIIMKTDNQQLFEYSLENLSNYNYRFEKVRLDLHNSDITDQVTTEYEEKFKKENKPIYMLIARK